MPGKRTVFFLASLLVSVGVLVTLENIKVIKGVSQHWPVFLLIAGCGFVLLFFQEYKTDLVKLWLGTFIFILGIFFYYLNFTTWANLARLWPLFLGAVGLSFLCIGIFSRSKMYNYFAISFITLFITLTLVFTISPRLWPLSFVVFGISLFILDHQLKKNLGGKNESI
jgi:hypothetical protein